MNGVPGSEKGFVPCIVVPGIGPSLASLFLA